MRTVKNLILGAGLAGLSAGFHLPRRETLILEREKEVGGLCRSRRLDGFVFDYTGHLLHLKDRKTRELVLSLLPEAFDTVERQARVYSKGTFTGYPFQANTHGLPREVIQECLVGFVEAAKNRERKPMEPKDFKEWVLTTFGEGIARHFMFPYNEKLYRTDLAQMECGWVSWSIPRPTLNQVVGGALGTTVQGLGYNPRFLYPRRGGIDLLPKALAARLENIELGKEVARVDPVCRTVALVGGEKIAYERLISTIPLDTLLKILLPVPAANLKKGATRLQAVRVINFNFGLNQPNCLPGHWVYYPEPEFPFYRVGSPSNYSNGVAPAGCSSLYVEVARRRDEKVDLPGLREEVLEGLHRAKVLNADRRILVEETQVLDPAYVLYDHFRRRALPGIHESLAHHGIFSTGRYGAWEYGSMGSALSQGREIAIHLESVEKRALGGVG